MRIWPAHKSIFTVFFQQMVVFRNKEILAAHCRYFQRYITGKPFDQIKIVTAFFQDMRSGNSRMSAPVAHYVAAMFRRDIFVAFDNHNLAEDTGIQNFLDFPVQPRITQYKAGSKMFTACLMGIVYCHTVINLGCQRFFRKDMFTGFERCYNMFFVKRIGRKNHHPIHTGKVYCFLIAAAMFGSCTVPFICGVFHYRWIRIIDRNNFDLTVRIIVDQMAYYAFGTASAADNGQFINFIFHNFYFVLILNCIFKFFTSRTLSCHLERLNADK